MATQATLLQRNTDFFYTSFLVASKKDNKPLYTPVLLYPIEVLNHEEGPELRINYGRVTLNPALFSLFEIPASFETKVLSLIPNGELNLATPGLLAKDLAHYIPELDITPVNSFPQLLSLAEVKACKNLTNPVLLPTAALILTEQSKNVAGLLHELEALLTHPTAEFPPALQALLGQPVFTSDEIKGSPTDDHSPTQLSPSQQQLLRSADEHPLTVCHGPPGTGKTFTVAAAALDQVARGNAVLIACRSEEAAAVIQSKLEQTLPQDQIVIRAGRSQHLSKLKGQLDQLLGTHATPPPLASAPEGKLRRLNKVLTKLRKHLKNRLHSEYQVASLFHSPPIGIWQKLNRWSHCQSLKRAPLLSQIVRKIIQTQDERLRLLSVHNEVVYQRNLQDHLSSPASRKILLAYREAIGRRAASTQERELLAVDLKTLLNYLPHLGHHHRRYSPRAALEARPLRPRHH